jgi:ribose transport system substrate-binding protein
VNTKHTLRGRRAIAAALGCVSALSLSSGHALAQDMAAVLATAEARVAELRLGTAAAVPTAGPTAVADKSVWIISCSQSIDLCSDEVNAIEEAATAIGWETNVVNAEFDPVVAGDAIRQAVAAQADGIIVFGFDCPLVSQPLQEAVDAGIKTLGVVALDCDDPALPGQTAPLFNVDMIFTPGGDTSYADFLYAYGVDKALLTIALSGGTAQIMDLQVPDLVSIAAVSRGFLDGLKPCTTCQIVTTVDLTTLDQINGVVEQKVTAELARNPGVDTIQMSTDGLLMTGVQTAILNSGRNDDLLVIGGEGYLSNLEAIRSNSGQDNALAFDARWEGWAAVDAMNRAFAGAEQVHGGQGYIYVDATTNMPESGAWDSNVDFRSAFKTLWGVGG